MRRLLSAEAPEMIGREEDLLDLTTAGVVQEHSRDPGLAQTHQSDNTNMLDFNKKYIDRIVKYKKNINDLGNDVWEGILPMLNEIKEETDEKKIISVYDKIYDWADGNDILIKSK